MGYIDAHVHVWTPDVDHYPLAPGYKKEDMKPPSFTPEELFRHSVRGRRGKEGTRGRRGVNAGPPVPGGDAERNEDYMKDKRNGEPGPDSKK